MNRSIETVLGKHGQLHSWTCAASAHELIAKLHDKIADDEFPLQNGPDAHKAGFQFEQFLNGLGFQGTERHEVPADALDLLNQETREGRYPLVSILVAVSGNKSYWHIVIAVQDQGEVILIDPKAKKQHSRDSQDTLAKLERTVAAKPDRPQIHLLTYSEAAP